MLARQATTRVEEFPLLVTQGPAVTLHTLTAVGLSVQGDASSMDTPGKKTKLQSVFLVKMKINKDVAYLRLFKNRWL